MQNSHYSGMWGTVQGWTELSPVLVTGATWRRRMGALEVGATHFRQMQTNLKSSRDGLLRGDIPYPELQSPHMLLIRVTDDSPDSGDGVQLFGASVEITGLVDSLEQRRTITAASSQITGNRLGTGAWEAIGPDQQIDIAFALPREMVGLRAERPPVPGRGLPGRRPAAPRLPAARGGRGGEILAVAPVERRRRHLLQGSPLRGGTLLHGAARRGPAPDRRHPDGGPFPPRHPHGPGLLRGRLRPDHGAPEPDGRVRSQPAGSSSSPPSTASATGSGPTRGTSRRCCASAGPATWAPRSSASNRPTEAGTTAGEAA